MTELGTRLARGAAAAFADLYDQCADRCHHYLSSFLGSRDAADDVLQETFVRLVRGRAKLATVDNLVAYVFAIARNEARRHAGRRARDRHQHTPLTAAEQFHDADDTLRRETAEIVTEGLRHLSAEQREVVELKIYGGLTFREIGQVRTRTTEALTGSGALFRPPFPAPT